MQTEMFLQDKRLVERINQIISESNGSRFRANPDDLENMPTNVQPYSLRFEECTNSNQDSIAYPEIVPRIRSSGNRQSSNNIPGKYPHDQANNSVWNSNFEKESSCQPNVISQEDIINVIDTLRAELIAARKKSEALEMEKRKRSWEKENELLELESSLKSLIHATHAKDRTFDVAPFPTVETARHYGDECARQSSRPTENTREVFLRRTNSGNEKQTFLTAKQGGTEEQSLKIVIQHPDLPEKSLYRKEREPDYLAELEEQLAENDKKAEDRTSAIVQKLQALEQTLQKSEKNEAQIQREHKARPDQSPRVESMQGDRSRKQYEELYGSAVEALELGKHILKDVDETAFNSLFTIGHRGVHALPSIIFCLYSAIRTLRSDLASKTAKYQESAEVIKNIKEEILSDKSKMASDFDKRFKEEKSRMHSELAAAIQRAEMATQEARTISERANKARESLQQELTEKNRTINELKKASMDENTKLNANIVTLEAKIHALETSLEESRCEATRLKIERDEATKHYSSLTAKLEAREEHLQKLENDLMDKNDKWRNAERKLQEATDALNRLYEVTTQATKTTSEITALLEKFGHRTKKRALHGRSISEEAPKSVGNSKKTVHRVLQTSYRTPKPHGSENLTLKRNGKASQDDERFPEYN
uniref:Uncharacterized protein n=1 Tax=Schistocephalus solidus TaxID=70667 RepID=A0A0X3PQ88_SCHSO